MEICYDLNGEVIVGTFHEKELQKTNQKEFRVLDLSNYAQKKKKEADSKSAAGVDTSKFAKKVDLASSKSEVDKLDIHKSEKVPTAL